MHEYVDTSRMVTKYIVGATPHNDARMSGGNLVYEVALRPVEIVIAYRC